VAGAAVDDVDPDGADEPEADPALVDDCDADVDVVVDVEPLPVQAPTTSRTVTSTTEPPRQRCRVTRAP
jgi:hypothetical protein